MASKTRRYARRFRRAKREYIWVTNLVENRRLVQGTNMDFIQALVAGVDWQRGAAPLGSRLEKGAVCLRIVGDVHVHIDPTDYASVRAFARQQFVWGIKREDSDITEVLDLSTNAFEEDWMHLEAPKLYSVVDATPTLALAVSVNTIVSSHVDIRVKRKLTSEDFISLYCAADPVAGLQTDVAISFMLRCLVQLP